ncbi:T9SS type A sorting domain-containing protein, partial [Balneolaceae bacterium ANBcel3]|nr:T9SS type A sorting domain-containing protein [Balneolaceae bacterium ANBcel3]
MNDSYAHATWMLYYAEKFGMEYWVDVWGEVAEDYHIDFFDAMDAQLIERGSGFEHALIQNHLWHMTSGLSAHNEYGFMDKQYYPQARFVQSTDKPMMFPGAETDIPFRAARYFMIEPENGLYYNNNLIAFFNASAGTGLGIVAKTNSGELYEWILPSEGRNIHLFELPIKIEELSWAALAKVHSGPSGYHRTRFLSASELSIESMKWGDFLESGEINRDDAVGMLTYTLSGGEMSFFQKYISDLSGDGRLTPYDASLLFRMLNDDTFYLPVDPNGNRQMLGLSDFERLDDHTDDPIAKIISERNTQNDSLQVRFVDISDDTGDDQSIDIALVVEGFADKDVYALTLDLRPGSSPLELKELWYGSLDSNYSAHVYNYEDGVLSIALGSAFPLEAPGIDSGSLKQGEKALLRLRFTSEIWGGISFDILDLEIDERSLAYKFEPLNISIPIFADTDPSLPDRVQLHQNYPNPFNPETVISFDLPRESRVALEVFDALGRRVALLKQEELAPGTHHVRWNAINLPSGVYISRLTTEDGS